MKKTREQLILESTLISNSNKDNGLNRFIYEDDKNPCWKGYTQVGMKKKGGKEVPNCVPTKDVPDAKGYSKKTKNLSEVFIEQFIHENKKIDKSKMKCNKPKAQPHGSGETGKSHVVKACDNGKEKIIRFGQKGVKGSPKKEGESDKYANRRKKFKARHAKNIAKGKMSAAYWANKVKW